MIATANKEQCETTTLSTATLQTVFLVIQSRYGTTSYWILDDVLSACFVAEVKPAVFSVAHQ
jgi:hypothetical protein